MLAKHFQLQASNRGSSSHYSVDHLVSIIPRLQVSFPDPQSHSQTLQFHSQTPSLIPRPPVSFPGSQSHSQTPQSHSQTPQSHSQAPIQCMSFSQYTESKSLVGLVLALGTRLNTTEIELSQSYMYTIYLSSVKRVVPLYTAKSLIPQQLQ